MAKALCYVYRLAKDKALAKKVEGVLTTKVEVELTGKQLETAFKLGAVAKVLEADEPKPEPEPKAKEPVEEKPADAE